MGLLQTYQASPKTIIIDGLIWRLFEPTAFVLDFYLAKAWGFSKFNLSGGTGFTGFRRMLGQAIAHVGVRQRTPTLMIANSQHQCSRNMPMPLPSGSPRISGDMAVWCRDSYRAFCYCKIPYGHISEMKNWKIITNHNKGIP